MMTHQTWGRGPYVTLISITGVMLVVALLYVLGDAQDERALEAAGISRAAELVATLPTDAENVKVTLTAHQCNPNLRIVTRAQQRATQDKLIRAGASRVICP